MSKFAEHTHESDDRHQLHSGNGLVIRPTCELDLDEIAEIAAEREGEEVEHWRHVFGRIYFDGQTSDQSLLLVATLPGQVLGYGRAAYFSPPENSPSNTAPEGWYLNGVVVRPAYRRRGVGAELTRERLASIAKRTAKAYYFANAQNRVSIELHRRFGFVEVTRDFWFPNVQFTGGVGILFYCDLNDKLKLSDRGHG